MNLFLIGYLGAFSKWLIAKCKNSYKNEYLGIGKHTRFFERISIEAENSILGFLTVLVLLFIFLMLFECFN